MSLRPHSSGCGCMWNIARDSMGRVPASIGYNSAEGITLAVECRRHQLRRRGHAWRKRLIVEVPDSVAGGW